MNRSIDFATGNRGKVAEAEVILAPFGIGVRSFDGKGVEIQADSVVEVASFSSRDAARRSGKAVVVEDAGLFVDSLNGFPGPFSAYVFKTVGIAGLLTLLMGEERKASFRSAVAYCEPGGKPVVFEGTVAGTVTSSPAGVGGFGFDPVFVPAGETRTLAEMSLEEKCGISHRGLAMRRFAAWFVSAARDG